MTLFAAYCSLLALSFGLLVFMGAAQRRVRARPRLPAPPGAPAVSILKPLCGIDPSLEENLHTFFRLDYPRYEVILGAADSGDPALDVARRVAARYPGVPCRVLHGSRASGGNPKVANLSNLLGHARHGLIWISDSNTAVSPDHLSDMAARLTEPGVGLVSSPILAIPGRGWGAALEALQINAFVQGGVAALHRIPGGVCVVGKSMLIRRGDLARIGGFRFLSGFLAEDQVCGEEIAARGMRLGLGGPPVRNPLGDVGLAGFAGRHLRWARIRRRICPAGYAGELLLEPGVLALAGLAFLPAGTAAVAAGCAFLFRALLDAEAVRNAGAAESAATALLLSPVRSMVVAALWPLGLTGGPVRWRGRRIVIGPRTRIVRVDEGPMRPRVAPEARRRDDLVGAAATGRPATRAGLPLPPRAPAPVP